MAERRKRKSLDVNFDYVFDRLLMHKLQQAYEILVPDNVRITGSQMEHTVHDDEAIPKSRARIPGENDKPQRIHDSHHRFGGLR